MAHVFRLHDGTEGTGWFTSAPITPQQIDSIITDGKAVASSIPSPFASIDLVKSAFEWVSRNEIEGNTAHHRLVSFALDVAQIFFYHSRYSNRVKVVSWNPTARIDNWKNGANQKHKDFGNTLDVFWRQDSNVYNFSRQQAFYLLLDQNNNLLGSTSPATMFMAAPDVVELAENLNIEFTTHIAFSTDNESYVPINQRDPQFIKYLYSLKLVEGFADYFKELDNYLTRAFNVLENSLRTEVAGLSYENINSFKKCHVSTDPNQLCEVLQQYYLKCESDDVAINTLIQESDFLIVDELNVAIKPLILPQGTFNQRWKYSSNTDLWDQTNEVPYCNHDVENSALPFNGINYKWLTIGNFVEDKLIKLAYKIDTSFFETCGTEDFLLPLKPEFFNYFKADNVKLKSSFQILAGRGVNFILKIPVRGGEITFNKHYPSNDIVEMNFMYLAIMPFMKTRDLRSNYHLALMDIRGNKTPEISMDCFNNNQICEIKQKGVRLDIPKEERITVYKVSTFDKIRINYGNTHAFIIPNLPEYNGNNNATFAIDFGTTNTHIAYKLPDSAERNMDNVNNSPLWKSLINLKESTNYPYIVREKDYFDLYLLPNEFHDGSENKFPLRTALLKNIDVNENQNLELFYHTNNFLLLEKQHYKTAYFELKNNLKWSNLNSTSEKQLVEKYIEGLLLLIYYKSVQLNCSLRNVKVIWFIPSSMTAFQKNEYRSIWEGKFKEIFGEENIQNIKVISESVAPYLKLRGTIPGKTLSIDIGGGTTDISYFDGQHQSPDFISSVKFAGNAVFGDGLPGEFENNTEINGFFKAFNPRIENLLTGNLKEIHNDIANVRQKSADFSSFLFSLENNNQVNFNYSNELRTHQKLKLPILLKYCALFYYAAELLRRTNGLEEYPSNIIFSGTASKSIKILDSHEFNQLKYVLSKIFKKVLNVDNPNLRIAISNNPKEITCSGGLAINFNGDQNLYNLNSIYWVGSQNENNNFGGLLSENDNNIMPKFNEVNFNIKKELLETHKEFYQLLDEILDNGPILENNFGISREAYLKFKELRSNENDLLGYLDQAIQAFGNAPDDNIQETLFFYPLIPLLNRLANELAN